MSHLAILQTANALRERIGPAVGGESQVHIGPPIASELGNKRVSLFLFHTQVNASLRNGQYLEPPGLGPAQGSAAERNALPLDLRFLISVFRRTLAGQPAGEPGELTTLGRVIQVLHAEPNLGGEAMAGQVVRVTPEPYPMEEISRVWGLFPQDAYRTSVVYLASPVFIDAGGVPAGLPVEERTSRGGLAGSESEGA